MHNSLQDYATGKPINYILSINNQKTWFTRNHNSRKQNGQGQQVFCFSMTYGDNEKYKNQIHVTMESFKL